MNDFRYTGNSISKSFDQFTKVFSGIDFCINNSSILGITGPNGSGKSTLLKIIAGLLSNTKGSLEFNINGKQLAKKDYSNHYSYVAPYLQIYEEFTPAEIMAIYCKFKNIILNKNRFNHLLDTFKLTKRKNDPIKSFSSGMKQRIKYILAFQNYNEIIFLDEPFSNLDNEGINSVKRLIEKHYEQGSAIVIAGNDDREISLCNGILELKK